MSSTGNAFKGLAQSLGTKAAVGGITGALGGGGLAGAASGAMGALGMGGAGAAGAAGLGGAMSGALAAMGPVGWAVLAASVIGSMVGGQKSRFDMIKEAYAKGQKTGDMTKFNTRMEKYPKAAQRFINKFGDPRPQQPGAMGAMPGMGPGVQPGSVPGMSGFMQGIMPQVMGNPAAFARPEAQSWLQSMFPQQPGGQMLQPQVGAGQMWAGGNPQGAGMGAGLVTTPNGVPWQNANGQVVTGFREDGTPIMGAPTPPGTTPFMPGIIQENPFAKAMPELLGRMQATPGPKEGLESILARYRGTLGNGGGEISPAMFRRNVA